MKVEIGAEYEGTNKSGTYFKAIVLSITYRTVRYRIIETDNRLMSKGKILTRRKRGFRNFYDRIEDTKYEIAKNYDI